MRNFYMLASICPIYKNFERIVIGVMLVCLLSSCIKAASLPADSMPDIGIPVDTMNSQFRLVAEPALNTFKISDIVLLYVQVLSDQDIAFKKDLGVRMFIHQDGEWIELRNLMINNTGVSIAQALKGQPGYVVESFVAPMVPDPRKVTLIRIISVGNIYQNGQVTEEQTAAYVDVMLEP